MDPHTLLYIQELLRCNDVLSARMIAQRLNMNKKEVNQIMYAMEKQGLVYAKDGYLPPHWGLPKDNVLVCIDDDNDNTDKQQMDQTHVYIDLDNVHDCFQHAACYTTHGDVIVHGFSGPVYNHWKPSEQEHRNVHYHTLDKQLKDIAELAMFMQVLQDVEHNNGKGTYLLVSKDKSVYTMCELVKKQLHASAEIHCLINWDQLKLHLA